MSNNKYDWIFTTIKKPESWIRPGEKGFVTEMSSWSGNGSPNPINGESMAHSVTRGQMQLDEPGADERNWLLRGEADGQKFVIRIYND